MKKNHTTLCYHFFNILYIVLLIGLICVLLYPYTIFYFKKNAFTPFFNTFNHRDVVLEKGESITLSVKRINKRVSYSSTNFKVASVNIWGRVRGHRVGTAIIKGKFQKKTVKCRVRVIALNKKKCKIKTGKKEKLRVKGDAFFVTWKSKDKSIARVNGFGKVTGIQKGSTVITATVKKKTLTCKITIE